MLKLERAIKSAKKSFPGKFSWDGHNTITVKFPNGTVDTFDVRDKAVAMVTMNKAKRTPGKAYQSLLKRMKRR